MPTIEDFFSHPIETLERALHIRKQIEEFQKQLSALVGARPPALAAIQVLEPTTKGKRTMSAAARARIAAAQRARWAKQKGSEPSQAAPAVKSKKPGLSAEGRARIIAAQKARWAAVKGRKSTMAPAKAAPRKKRQLSPEARARIVAAVKARWAREKQGK